MSKLEREICFGLDAQRRHLSGITTLAEAVGVTLGPSGRCVTFEGKFGGHFVTKDGVTVANQIDSTDELESQAINIMKHAARNTVSEAGDGTTTCIVLGHEIMEQGFRLSAQHNIHEIKRGIDLATEHCVKFISSIAQPISIEDWDDLLNVATISANGDRDSGRLIAQALKMVNGEGVVIVEEGRSETDEIVLAQGAEYERGYINPYMMTDPKTGMATYEGCKVLISQDVLNDPHEILEIVNQCHAQQMPLLLIARNFGEKVIEFLVKNRIQHKLRVVAIQSPLYGDRQLAVLEDIAILSGGRVTGAHVAVKPAMNHLGEFKKVVIGPRSSLFVSHDSVNERVELRVEELEAQIQGCDSDYDREKLQARLAIFKGGIARIRVGAKSDVELKERKDRIDDALNAALCALDEGIVPGGGITMLRAAQNLEALTKTDEFVNLTDGEKTGVRILINALHKPLYKICQNCGLNGEVIKAQVDFGTETLAKTFRDRNSMWVGYDARAHEVVYLNDAGIFDPARVSKAALKNAVSIAGTLLTSGCSIVITHRPEDSVRSYED